MPEHKQHFEKTRIAPTPSGFLHLGNALSFALTAALARKNGAKILLRIDDLDQDRINEVYVQDIFDTLNFLAIPWDEGPRNIDEYKSSWSQMHRMELYKNALIQLEEQRDVFACQCSRSQLQGNIYPGTCRNRSLPLDTPNVSWRLYTDNRELSIKTLMDGTTKNRLPDTMEDFIVKKKDDYPAYQLASAIDDLHFGVDLIVRGHDLWPSTLAQHFLADVLGYDDFEQITFHHHDLLMADNGSKLSKSAGDTSIKHMREQGKKPSNVFNQIGQLLGISYEMNNLDDFFALMSL